MEVCRMRNTPVIVFINKLDREGRDPYDLLEEIDKELSINNRPLSWPIGMGSEFKGVYNLYDKTLQLFFSADKQRISEDIIAIDDLQDPLLEKYVGEHYGKQLREDGSLIGGGFEPLDI